MINLEQIEQKDLLHTPYSSTFVMVSLMFQLSKKTDIQTWYFHVTCRYFLIKYMIP